MNSFDIAVLLGLAIAVGTGFSTGLIRSAITILAYIVAMPITVWVMSFVPPLTANANSPLMQNAGFFLGAFLVIGMVIGKLARIPVDEAIGTDIGLVDRLSGAAPLDHLCVKHLGGSLRVVVAFEGPHRAWILPPP